MKKLLLVLLVIPSILFGQSDVPDKYWLDDSNYEDVINGKEAFGDDEIEIKVVEYWAKFNEKNCFSDWDKLQDVQYYRVDIAKAPKYKKEHRVRMAPTIIVWKDGIEKTYKAGLDLECPVNLSELQEKIEEVKEASAF